MCVIAALKEIQRINRSVQCGVGLQTHFLYYISFQSILKLTVDC